MNRFAEAGRKSRRSDMLEVRAARIDQHDTAITAARIGFDFPTQCIENDVKRIAGRDHLEQALLAPEKRFCAFTRMNVGVQNEPSQDATGGVAHGQTSNVKPSVLAIRSADAMARPFSSASRLPISRSAQETAFLT